MKTVKTTLGIAACLAVAGIAYAAVIVDSECIGFAGKGDVQLVMDPPWNNAQLQTAANAGQVKFRALWSESTSWDCEKEGKKETQTQTRTQKSAITSTIAYDARKNNKGQITGFNLNGKDLTTPPTEESNGPELHSCPSQWTLVPDSDVITGGDTTLEVSGDGGANWVNLPITL